MLLALLNRPAADRRRADGGRQDDVRKETIPPRHFAGRHRTRRISSAVFTACRTTYSWASETLSLADFAASLAGSLDAVRAT